MLDLRALKNLPARVTLEEDAKRLDLNVIGMTVTGAARAELNIIQGDGVFYCSGRACCDVDFECSRCLMPFRYALEGEVDFSIQEVESAEQVDRDLIPDGELIVLAGTADVDISDPVREALLLAVPLQPLCREECRGLCPHCGANRNEQDCNCAEETTDSRWDGLRNLFKKRTAEREGKE